MPKFLYTPIELLKHPHVNEPALPLAIACRKHCDRKKITITGFPTG